MPKKSSHQEALEVFCEHFPPGGLQSSSIKYFLETGKISGELYLAINAIADKAYNRGIRESPRPGEIMRYLIIDPNLSPIWTDSFDISDWHIDLWVIDVPERKWFDGESWLPINPGVFF